MKRLKIAEQILIVLVVALLVPLIIAGIIIINTNQIAVRKELVSSATIIANTISGEFNAVSVFEQKNLDGIYEAYKRIPTSKARSAFIKHIEDLNPNTVKIAITPATKNNTQLQSYSKNNNTITYSIKKDNHIISKTVNTNYLKAIIFDKFNAQGRQIYVLNKSLSPVMSVDFDATRYKDILLSMPKNPNPLIINVFDKQKNEPNVAVFYPELEWIIIVASPSELTKYGIIGAGFKITMAIILAAAFVFVTFGIYTFSLYTTIRQFFKGIQSIAQGNYIRKVRLVKNILTPQETVFITTEFNKMVEKINKSYEELHASNRKLKKLDEYKSNLINTVSHEFRTPLTSIRGYASSLLRHEATIDSESRKKSLKIIKQQSERLSRMVEDLLVIPDLETTTLRMKFVELNLEEIIETCILSTSKGETADFITDIKEGIATVYADEDRLIQIFVNLFENAVKYAKPDTKINVKAYTDEDFAHISVQNEAEHIDEDSLNTLFEKFTRIENDLTRTTRGTGLGLFIVKGLIETMGGDILLSSDNGFEVQFTIPVFKGQQYEN